eukprot:3656033-Pyramimonas_sp.AAC.1
MHGIAKLETMSTEVLVPGRVSMMCHSGFAKHGVLVVNVYPLSGEGMSASNFQILMKLAERLRGVNMPYITGGDFNCTPDDARQSGILKYFEAD